MQKMVLEFDANEVFYQRIIDNNIFRPLGWQPEKVIFPYKLVGTMIYTNEKKKSTAIIQETTVDAAEKIYFVSTGDMIGNITVIDIQSKQVTLEKVNKKITLNIIPKFLNLPSTVMHPFRIRTGQESKKPSQAKNLRIDKKPPEVIPDLPVGDIERFKRNPSTPRNTFRLW